MNARLLTQAFFGEIDMPERSPRVRGSARHLPRPHVGGRGAAVRGRLLELLGGGLEEPGRRLEILVRAHER